MKKVKGAGLYLAIVVISITCVRSVATEYRTWTTKAGKQAKAGIVSYDGMILTMQGEQGTEFKVAIEQFAPGDVRHIDELRMSGDIPHSIQIVGAGGGYPDRILVPTYNQSDFARGEKSCGPNAFSNFVLWWDRIGVLDIPEGNTEREKAEWLHKELRKLFSAGNGTTATEMIKGIDAYFKKYPSRKYEFKTRVLYPVTIEDMERETQGLNATILYVSTAEKGKINEKLGHFTSLLTVSRKGAFLLNTWGSLFRGQILLRETIPGSGPNGKASQVMALELTADANSERFRNAKEQWIVDPRMGNCMIVVIPEPLATQGNRL